MQQELICQGGIQINAQIVNSSALSTSADLPNGPQPGQIWAVDRIGALFSVENTAGTDTVQQPWSGIYVVPISAPKPDDTDSFGFINLAARGLPLVIPIDVANMTEFFTLPGNGYGVMVVDGPVIVPAGFTIRAVVTVTNGTSGPSGTVQLNLYAQLRILQQN